MSAATWVDPNYTTAPDANTYKANLDAGHKVAKRIVDMFACHERVSGGPNLSVDVDAGVLWNGSALTEVAAQNVAGFTAPVTNPRIDRVVLDPVSGTASRVAGTEAASPVAPAIPAGKVPLCRVTLPAAVASVTNAIVDDERVVATSSTPIVLEITGNTTLVAGDAGKTVHVADKADVTLPALSALPIGAQFEIVSGTAKRQRIYAAGADSLEGVAGGFYRLPSFETAVIRKVATALWRVVQRPAHGVGQVIEWSGSAGNAAEIFGPGYVELTGAAQTLSRTDYENLFDVCATTWGTGDGATTFTLPASSGRSTVGAGTGASLTARTVGQTGGEEGHALTSAENGAHSHTDSGHAHSYNAPTYVGILSSGEVNGSPQPAGSTTGTGYANISSSGSGTAHNTMHPFSVVRRLIKV